MEIISYVYSRFKRSKVVSDTHNKQHKSVKKNYIVFVSSVGDTQGCILEIKRQHYNHNSPIYVECQTQLA